MTTDPRPEVLHGFIVGSYEQFVATLAASRERQALTFAEIARRMGRCYLQQVFTWLNGGAECRARRLFAPCSCPRLRRRPATPRTWSRAGPPGGRGCLTTTRTPTSHRCNAEAEARNWASWALVQGVTDGPHLHKRTVTVTDWTEVDT